MHTIRPLQDFNYYEGQVDKGSGVREKSKQLLELLASNEMIRSERDKARKLRDKFVGISNSGGGFGGDSYSNYGRDNSYSSGGIGKESYSSGGLDRDRRSKYDSNDSSTKKERYGGGSYDSSRPPRYGDDNYDRNDRERERDPDPEDDVVAKSSVKPKAKKSGASNSSGAKLKVSIKDSAVSSPVVAQSPAPAVAVKAAGPEIDFFSANNSNSAPDFFGTSAPAPAPVAPAPGNAFGGFDAFAVAPSASAATPVFDPFATAPPPTQASLFPPQPPAFGGAPVPTGFAPANSFPPATTPTQGSSFGAFTGASAVPAPSHFPVATLQTSAPISMTGYNNQSVGSAGGYVPQGYGGTPLGHYVSANSTNPQVSKPAQEPAGNDFGDFETAPNQKGDAAPAGANKWLDVAGGLVDLGNLSLNQSQKISKDSGWGGAQAQQTQNSFAGLDGFSKSTATVGGSC